MSNLKVCKRSEILGGVMKDIVKIAKSIGINDEDVECYGRYKAKIRNLKCAPKGKLILVTAMTPTKSGEGKTTISIGLADAINSLGKKVSLALREPSLGPTFGMKGGATGGGNSTIEPADDINLHFTGDMHAITTANNLLCANIDNHIYQGNELDIQKVTFPRCMDLNDRALREITINEEKLKNNHPRHDSFVITPASEIMAILCLSENEKDLQKRLGDVIIGENSKGEFVYAKDLKIVKSLMKILKDAMYPNLVQTAEGTPCFVHGGPFANIAQGTNSVIATKTALTFSDFVVTEAGFGADLGAEKFFDLKCREAKLDVNVVVLVVTMKAIKEHGLENVLKHIDVLENVFNKSCVVAFNHFAGDSEKEIEKFKSVCSVPCCVCYPFEQGGKGCVELSKTVIENMTNSKLKFAYSKSASIKEKIESIAKKVYGAKNVEFSSVAEEKLQKYEHLAKNYEVVIAKSQYALIDENDKKSKTLKVQDLSLKNGARFVVALCGKINLMPGLPKHPKEG